MNTQGYQYGSISTLAWLPAGVSSASIKQVSDKYYGNLIRSSDSPSNVQQFHSIEVVTDTRNVLNCIPALGAGDGGGASGSNYILTEYNSEPMKGLLSKVTLVYSIFRRIHSERHGHRTKFHKTSFHCGMAKRRNVIS